MAGEFKLSRIRFKWVGDWAPDTDYAKDDIVEYGGKVYTALVKHTSRVLFYDDLLNEDGSTIPATPTPYWKLLIDGRQWRGAWQGDEYYNLGNIVKYQGIVYICILQHTSSDIGLENNIQNWRIHNFTDMWKSEWQPQTYYSSNDVVIHSGTLYRCVTAHESQGLPLGLEGSLLNWEIVAEGDNWRFNWQDSTLYRVNDVVKYGGIIYQCITGHLSASDPADGLELDSGKWNVYIENIEYKGYWQAADLQVEPPVAGTRYKKNDIVKWGAGIYKCIKGHTSTAVFEDFQEADPKWELYVPGFEFENDWQLGTVYQKGDVVRYGGYLYTALRQNDGNVPSVEFGDSSIANWELLKTGYRVVEGGEWDLLENYLVGNVVRRSGHVYVAIKDSLGVNPNEDETNIINPSWELVVPGEKYKSSWLTATDYQLGDVILWKGTSYRCIQHHTSDFNTRPDNDYDRLYWDLHGFGDVNNQLQYKGDLKIFGLTEDQSTQDKTRLAVGTEGQVLAVSATSEPSWETFGEGTKVYYVDTKGIDAPDKGTTPETPFRTIRYACDSITGPATILVKVGVYYEKLPIKVPRDVAVVGEELRSTVVEPLVDLDNISPNPEFDSGLPEDPITNPLTISDPLDFRATDMFHVNNGTGIRNMTLRGKVGELGDFNEQLTRRPTGGSYVSLDPGSGPTDQSVWITNKSCYVQNVTTFGFGCVGLKIDGALHNGGNKSIVANDFTQICSDGIGVWCTNKARSELVSVFSYYAHIGYLSEAGGKIRATNGNSSYGDYGCVAEGVDVDESPISGIINNRNNQAIVDSAFTGEQGNEILRFEFKHAGENYSQVAYNILGSGTGLEVIGNEFRDGGVFNIRLQESADSTEPLGGSGFINVGNNAQSGTDTYIQIAGNDDNDISIYGGCRIIITSGTGVGQYGYVSAYNIVNKNITVRRESDDQIGWDHINPGTPIEPVLNTTTVYRIEPRIEFDDAPYSISDSSLQTSDTWSDAISFGENTIIVGSGSGAYVRINGGNAFNGSIGFPANRIAHNGVDKFVVIGTGNQVAFSTDGASWANASKPSSAVHTGLTYGQDKWIAIERNSTNFIYSYDNLSWYEKSDLPGNRTWTGLAYGKKKFVAVNESNTFSWSDGLSKASNTALAGFFSDRRLGNPTTIDAFMDTTVNGFARGDINNDGAIDIDDQLLFAQYVNGTLTSGADYEWIVNNIITPIEATAETFDQDFLEIQWNDVTVPDFGDSAQPTWSDVTFGNNRFVAVSDNSEAMAYSFDAINWYLGRLSFDAAFKRVKYGQGRFVAIPTNETRYTTSDGGYIWETKTTNIASLAAGQNLGVGCFGNPGNTPTWLITSTDSDEFYIATIGTKARGRVVIDGGAVDRIKIWEPGSGYTTPPSITYTDPNFTIPPTTINRIGNGVLANPTFVTRGSGYKGSTTRISLTGNGYAEIYPFGRGLRIEGLPRVPRTGANLAIDIVAWTSGSVPLDASWNDIAFGNGVFVATGQGVTGLYSSDAVNWQTMTLHAGGFNGAVEFGTDAFVVVGDDASFCGRSTDGINWSSVDLPNYGVWKDIAYGNGTFVIVRDSSTTCAYSKDEGQTWLEAALPADTSWSSITYGQNGFIAIAEGTNAGATSEDGVTWTDITLPSVANWSNIVHGQGRYLIIAANDTKVAITSNGGQTWTDGTLPAIRHWRPAGYANNRFLIFSDTSPDFVTTSDGIVFTSRSQPLIGGVTAFITGQQKLVSINGTDLAYANDGSQQQIYRVLTVNNISGGNSDFDMDITVSPQFSFNNGPEHNTTVEIRELYSQVRLTGHDFLEIGTGNFDETSYPNTNLTNLAPFNEVYYNTGGRVFYSSTDQDGNFRVGELFAVEQATGIVTISADYFDLNGLSEIQLGGIRVGGTGVVIREFSTDATFSADSNNVVPTQRAIKAYIERRISGGGSNASTGTLVAGTVAIGGPNRIYSTVNEAVEIPIVMNLKKGYDGIELAKTFFHESFNSGLDMQEGIREHG